MCVWPLALIDAKRFAGGRGCTKVPENLGDLVAGRPSFGRVRTTSSSSTIAASQVHPQVEPGASFVICNPASTVSGGGGIQRHAGGSPLSDEKPHWFPVGQ